MRIASALIVFLVACAGGENQAQAHVQAQVRAAYLDAWAVRDTAIHRGDSTFLDRRFAGGDPSAVVGNLSPGAPSALDIVSASVAARVEVGLDVEGEVGHEIQSVEVSDDGESAQVVDRITDRTYLVDRVTRIERGSRETATYTEVWFFVRRDGQWKVIYLARA